MRDREKLDDSNVFSIDEIRTKEDAGGEDEGHAKDETQDETRRNTKQHSMEGGEKGGTRGDKMSRTTLTFLEVNECSG